MLDKNFINVLSNEKADGYEQGYITRDILKQSLTGKGMLVYVCGPEPMMEAIEKQLLDLGVDAKAIIKEEF
jgi:ferredoxin-NADP reductase